MRVTKKQLFIGTPLAMAAVAIVAALALWAFMGGAGGALGENAKVSTNVEWKVFDSQGILKSQGAAHNFTARNLLDTARDRLSVAATQTAASIFSNISLCSAAQTGIAANDGVATGACTLSTPANVVEGNPVLAVIASGAGSKYTATKTVTAVTANVVIVELELSKNLVANTAPAVGDIGAVQAVTITLAPADTLQVTWTVDVN